MIRYILFVVLILVFSSACLDEITLKDLGFSTKALVIQGKIIHGSRTSFAEVIIQRLGDFGTNERETNIASAKVDLLDETDNAIELKTDPNKFIFKVSIPANHPSFKVTLGKSYRIRVIMPDGKKYMSKPEIIIPTPKVESMTANHDTITFLDYNQIVQQAKILQFKVNTPFYSANNTNKVRLRWESFITYKITDDAEKVCYSIEPLDLDKHLVKDPYAENLEVLKSFVIAETHFDYRFAEGSFVTLIQESLSEPAFTYFNQVNLLSERTGNMFEAPAATISTNIYNTSDSTEKVFGYFYGSTQDTFRFFVDTLAVGSIKKYCPQPPTQRIGPTICDNCLLIGANTTTTVKPFYWR